MKKDLSWIEVISSLLYASLFCILFFLGAKSFVISMMVWIFFINAKRILIFRKRYDI